MQEVEEMEVLQKETTGEERNTDKAVDNTSTMEVGTVRSPPGNSLTDLIMESGPSLNSEDEITDPIAALKTQAEADIDRHVPFTVRKENSATAKRSERLIEVVGFALLNCVEGCVLPV